MKSEISVGNLLVSFWRKIPPEILHFLVVSGAWPMTVCVTFNLSYLLKNVNKRFEFMFFLSIDII